MAARRRKLFVNRLFVSDDALLHVLRRGIVICIGADLNVVAYFEDPRSNYNRTLMSSAKPKHTPIWRIVCPEPATTLFCSDVDLGPSRRQLISNFSPSLHRILDAPVSKRLDVP